MWGQVLFGLVNNNYIDWSHSAFLYIHHILVDTAHLNNAPVDPHHRHVEWKALASWGNRNHFCSARPLQTETDLSPFSECNVTNKSHRPGCAITHQTTFLKNEWIAWALRWTFIPSLTGWRMADEYLLGTIYANHLCANVLLDCGCLVTPETTTLCPFGCHWKEHTCSSSTALQAFHRVAGKYFISNASECFVVD